MQVAQAFARALTEFGDSLLFGLMGNTNMGLIAAFRELPGCRYIPVANEDAAICMASGYASVTGNVGLATVIKGPGVTNTLTALCDAAAARMPLVVIAADAATGVRADLQKLPQKEFLALTGAGIQEVRTPAQALDDLRTARVRAVTESRPIVVNVPLEMLKADIEYTTGGPQPTDRDEIPAVDSGELDKALGVIASARRPLILAGRGAARKDAREAILRLSRQIGAPLSTTLRGRDLFRGEPDDVGLFGTLASDRTSEVIRLADCVIAFGTSLNYRTTDSGGLLEGKGVVQVDTRRDVIGEGADVDAAVVGDAGVVADSMVRWLELGQVQPTSFLEHVRRLEVGAPVRAKPHRPGTVDFHAALRAIERSVPADRVLTVDNGHFMYSTFKSVSVRDPFSYVHTTSVGSIGLGLGHAIGAAFGAPGRPTLLIAGDGGFMCSGIAEFRTAVTNGLDLIVALLNDAAFGAEYVRMVAHGMDPAVSTFDRPDFAAVGVALGGEGFTVADDESLRRVPDVIAKRSRPLLLDFRIDPAAITKAPVPA